MFHTELWDEFNILLENISEYIVLYIGLYVENDNHRIILALKKSNIVHHIQYFDNYGCDVAPFLQQIQKVSEPLFIKLHSKKSQLGAHHHMNWRAILLHGLIGSADIFNQNIITMANHDIGMLSSDSSLLFHREGKNRQKIKELCQNLNIDYSKVHNASFVAGNMFLSRTPVFQRYFKDDILEDILTKLRKEPGKVNDALVGTYSHSLERIFGYIITQTKLSFAFTDYITSKVNILTSEVLSGKLTMIILYNQNCYIQEHMNLYGEILDNNESQMIIRWKHNRVPVNQIYRKLSYNTIQKI